MKFQREFVVLILCISFRFLHVDASFKFPSNFSFGVGTSAYQVEGAFTTADKGESVLDRITRKDSEFFRGSRGDVSAESYTFFKRDIEMLQELNASVYHFSIAWSRLLPTGFSNSVSRDGLRYYHSLIDGLLAKNITPRVTLYHWDLPQKLQDMGGWSNPMMIEHFVDYARVAFTEFGKKVKMWITFDDVSVICNSGKRTYLPQYLPNEGISGVTDYLCAQNVLLAHAKTWMMYNQMFRNEQKGRVGISFSAYWVEPLTNSTRDMEIADLATQFLFDRFAHPIFSRAGDYPMAFKNAVAYRSAIQGRPASRLLPLAPADLTLLRGAADFMGISVFGNTSLLAFREIIGQRPFNAEPSVEDDLGLFNVDVTTLETSKQMFNVHSSVLYKILMRIKEKYNNTEVIVTGSGIGTTAGLLDLSRVFYIQSNVQDVGRAVRDGCNVTAYTYWTLMDGFQWMDGYRVRTGLYEVDFKSPKKTRTPRISSLVYKNIIETREVNPLYNPEIPKGMLSSSGLYIHKSVGTYVLTIASLLIWSLVRFF